MGPFQYYRTGPHPVPYGEFVIVTTFEHLLRTMHFADKHFMCYNILLSMVLLLQFYR